LEKFWRDIWFLMVLDI